LTYQDRVRVNGRGEGKQHRAMCTGVSVIGDGVMEEKSDGHPVSEGKESEA